MLGHQKVRVQNGRNTVVRSEEPVSFLKQSIRITSSSNKY